MLGVLHADNAATSDAVADFSERKGPSFRRARDILRQKSQLTLDQFHELDKLFADISPAQFTNLMTDDQHLQQIRQYEILAWRHPRAAGPIVAVLLLAIAFSAVVALWGI
ncbi:MULTISPECIES: hypothetical protein [Novosphingobium]|jgi:hypothetical protein|uniref:hypothetical protein n=1 Tax=Novosphingobium TaxID=165696 RepID=UPI0022F2A316|nr:hypothetical protein [Novosphingobium resinovorum]GLK44882.1 hypothetical protein GCM10017612_28020 [Novosphingobium resinovorum]